jgi:hypothetical protein
MKKFNLYLNLILIFTIGFIGCIFCLWVAFGEYWLITLPICLFVGIWYLKKGEKRRFDQFKRKF